MAFAQYQFRRDTAANWTSANSVLLAGELGYETDTQKFKIGNGTTAWNSLPYGGIKGDTGATGAAGVSPTVTVGATTVVTPATNPSVTDADAGANADLRFSLPRARNVTAGTTTTGAAGTSASVTSQADANGDVSLNFTIPRGDTGATGATGPTGPAANSFTNIAVTGQNTVVADQANDTLTLVAGTNITLTTNDVADSVTIAATIAAQNQFATVSVGTSPTPTLIQADTAADTLTVNAGTGISLTADAATDTFSIVNADTGSAARTAHEAAADPHPQYTTAAEAAAAAPVQSVSAGTGISVNQTTGAVVVTNAGVTSVNGQTGAVTVPAAAVAVTNTARSASFSTAVTTVASYPITGGSIAAGHVYRFEALLLITNTVTASNLVATVAVGATAVATLTQALGTTARTNQIAVIQGRIHFQSATAADGFVRAFASTATAFDAAAGTGAASVTVATAANTDVNLKLNTNAATSTIVVQSVSIEKVK